jgi:DcaP outer membrane protein
MNGAVSPRASAGVAVVVTVALLIGMASVAAAQKSSKSTKPATPTLSQRVAEQKKEIEAQQATIELQKALIDTLKTIADSQSVSMGAQQIRLGQLETELAEMKKRLEIVETQANLPAWEDSLEVRLKKIETATQKSPELPPDIVSAGDFPGSIRIPGSDAAVKFGGRARTAAVLTLDPLGTDDRFLTNSIPVGQPAVGEARRTNVSARASRLNIEFRTPGGVEELRAYFEGDFAGGTTTQNTKPIDSFRMRHAYAQYRGFIAGQTWSTFSDPNVELEDLDFEGVSSENVIRQPQVRYWRALNPNTRAAVAIETPAASITGAQGVNLFPDVIARVFLGRAAGGHLQVAGVLRQIRGETSTGVVRSEWGGGGTVSGVRLIHIGDLTDRLVFQINGGRGIARYINDLNSAGGQDAVFDTTTNELHPLSVLGWYIGYEHHWKEWKTAQKTNLRSTVLWSPVIVDNIDSQPPDAYHSTNRFAANLIFSPTSRVDFGVEYLYGIRTNKDRQSAHANQVQAVALFRF